MEVETILQSWVAGRSPTEADRQVLVREAIADSLRAKVFGLSSSNVEEVIDERSRLFEAVYLDLEAFFPAISQNLDTLWNFWLPLAVQIAQLRQLLGRPLIQGILGGQGTGKSTMAKILSLILSHLGYDALCFSLDDLYKTYIERQRLQQDDPRLIWRGPPGTHDVQLGLQVLSQLRQPGWRYPIIVPRFDKSAWNGLGDRSSPDVVQDVDIVLFEGWFVGVGSIADEAFDDAPLPILTVEDRGFARDMNARLAEYLPLWKCLDRLVLLYPSDYRLSQHWRCQAEREMIESGKSGMSDLEVNQFVEYFWKSLHPELFIAPLRYSHEVDVVVELKGDRSISRIYQPSDIVGKLK